MYRFIFLIILSIFFDYNRHAIAQDSLITSGVNHAEYAHSIVHHEIYEYMIANPVWIGRGVLDSFNVVNLGLGYTKGGWIDAQGADKIRSLRVGTEGKINLNKMSLWGRFRYNRAVEDSTMLRHQTRINTDAPLYFGSLRKNYYERDTYQLSVSAQYGLADHRWPVTLAIDYRVGNHFSNNDPRGRIADFQLDSYLGLGRKWENWSVHLGGILGYGRERVSIDYKNEKHKENTSDPLYVNWYMNGFGRATQKLSDLKYNDDFRRLGGRIHLSVVTNGWGSLFGTLQAVREKQHFKFYDNSPRTYRDLNRYTRDRYDVDLLWSFHGREQRATSFRFQSGAVDGKDLNYDLMRENYSFQQQYARLIFIRRQAPWEWNISSEWSSRSQHDASTGIRQKNQYFEPAAAIRYQFALDHRQFLAPGAWGGCRHTFGDQIQFPQGLMGDFAEFIIPYNAAYLSTPSFFFGLGADYQFRRSAKSAVGLTLKTTYRRRTHNLHDHAAPHLPGLDRLTTEMTVGYYF